MSKLKIFISYSWDDNEHKVWVKQLSGDIELYEEFYDLDYKVDKNYFMEKDLYDCDIKR